MAGKYLKKFGVRLDPESEVIVCLGSKEGFSHMCLALLGPGDTAIVPAPYFPVHVYAVALAAGNVIALEVADSEKFLSNVAYTCEHLYPRPKLLILNYPHNPSTVDGRAGVLRRGREAGPPVRLHGDQRLRLRRRRVRRLPAAQLSCRRPARSEVGVEFTTMSKGYNMAGWRVGFCAGNAEMVRALGTIKGYYDYGMFQADPDRRDHGAAARRRRRSKPKPRCISAAATCCVDGLRRIGWDVTPPRAGMFVWAKIPEPWASQMDTMDFAMKLLEEGDVAVSPGSGFGPAGEGYLRLALVENENRLRQAVRQIGRCLGSDIAADRRRGRRSARGQLVARPLAHF